MKYKQLLLAVDITLLLDESGDATLDNYILNQETLTGNETICELLEGFLKDANGPDWSFKTLKKDLEDIAGPEYSDWRTSVARKHLEALKSNGNNSEVE